MQSWNTKDNFVSISLTGTRSFCFCPNIYWAWSTELLFPLISATGSGQQCCFNRYGNLVMGQPDAGFLDRVHPNAGLPVISRFFHDKVPYEDCSRNAVVRFLNSESVCRQICTPKSVVYISATCFRDPHTVILDEKPFTLNGYEEYFNFKGKGVYFYSGETYGASTSRPWIALESHGIHGICSQRKWIRRCTGQENMGNTEILIILCMWWLGTWEFNFDK